MSADPQKLKVENEIGRSDTLFSLAHRPESPELFFGSSDFNAYRGDLAAEKFEPQAYAGHESYVTGVTLASDQLVTGSYDGQLIWWNIDSGEPVRSIKAHDLWIRNCVASPDGKLIASVADDMICRLWNAADGSKLKELSGHEKLTPNHFPSMLYAVAFTPDGKHLATADRTGRIVVWEIESGEMAAELEAPIMYTWDPKRRIHSIGGIRSLCFSPDGQQLAVGGMGQVGNIDHLQGKLRLELFAWEQGEKQLEYESDKHKGLCEQIVYDRSGSYVIFGGGDNSGCLEILDLANHKPIKQEKAPMHIHDMALSEDGESLYTVGHRRIVQWSLRG